MFWSINTETQRDTDRRTQTEKRNSPKEIKDREQIGESEEQVRPLQGDQGSSAVKTQIPSGINVNAESAVKAHQRAGVQNKPANDQY